MSSEQGLGGLLVIVAGKIHIRVMCPHVLVGSDCYTSLSTAGFPVPVIYPPSKS